MSTGTPSVAMAEAMVPRVEESEVVTVSAVTPPAAALLGTRMRAVTTTLPAATPMATSATSTPACRG